MCLVTIGTCVMEIKTTGFMVPVNVLPRSLLTTNKWLRPAQGEIAHINNRKEMMSTLNISFDTQLHIKYFNHFTIVYFNSSTLLFQL